MSVYQVYSCSSLLFKGGVSLHLPHVSMHDIVSDEIVIFPVFRCAMIVLRFLELNFDEGLDNVASFLKSTVLPQAEGVL